MAPVPPPRSALFAFHTWVARLAFFKAKFEKSGIGWRQKIPLAFWLFLGGGGFFFLHAKIACT